MFLAPTGAFPFGAKVFYPTIYNYIYNEMEWI